MIYLREDTGRELNSWGEFCEFVKTHRIERSVKLFFDFNHRLNFSSNIEMYPYTAIYKGAYIDFVQKGATFTLTKEDFAGAVVAGNQVVIMLKGGGQGFLQYPDIFE